MHERLVLIDERSVTAQTHEGTPALLPVRVEGGIREGARHLRAPPLDEDLRVAIAAVPRAERSEADRTLEGPQGGRPESAEHVRAHERRPPQACHEGESGRDGEQDGEAPDAGGHGMGRQCPGSALGPGLKRKIW